MPILSTIEVRAAAQRARPSTKTPGTVLLEATRLNEQNRTRGTRFDIFLSHAKSDAEIVLGIKQILEDAKLTVYVDWIEDPKLNRSSVTPETAEILRQRMRSCRSLFFIDTDGSVDSQWMPWECGYFDAFSSNGGSAVPKVAVVPVRDNARTYYAGREFLGLYFYITLSKDTTGTQTVYVHNSQTSYTTYSNWQRNGLPLRR